MNEEPYATTNWAAEIERRDRRIEALETQLAIADQTPDIDEYVMERDMLKDELGLLQAIYASARETIAELVRAAEAADHVAGVALARITELEAAVTSQGATLRRQEKYIVHLEAQIDKRR